MSRAKPGAGILLVGVPDALATEFVQEARGFRQTCWSAAETGCWDDAAPPDLVVVNLDDPRCLETVCALRRRLPEASLAAVTTTVSVDRIVEAVHQGVDTVLARPTTLRQIIAAVHPARRPARDEDTTSFDLVIWKYVSQVVAEEGSISGAARRLRIHRTSLKRILRRVPPQP